MSEALSNLRHGNASRRSKSVIGLSIAWKLARRGLSVAVFERGTAGSGACLADTGMLAAAAEHEPGCHDLLALALESQRQRPEVRGKLEAQSGYDIDFARSEHRFELTNLRSGQILSWKAASLVQIMTESQPLDFAAVKRHYERATRLLPASSAPNTTRSTRVW